MVNRPAWNWPCLPNEERRQLFLVRSKSRKERTEGREAGTEGREGRSKSREAGTEGREGRRACTPEAGHTPRNWSGSSSALPAHGLEAPVGLLLAHLDLVVALGEVAA
jgi:hypothetical protein